MNDIQITFIGSISLPKKKPQDNDELAAKENDAKPEGLYILYSKLFKSI